MFNNEEIQTQIEWLIEFQQDDLLLFESDLDGLLQAQPADDEEW